MPIVPLPQFETDLAQYLSEKEDREVYQRLRAPTTMVVRFGAMLMVGEFPYDGVSKPGCGSKIVVRTHRGTEVGEMLTSTCENAGCAKSVTRKEMLEYIENSGGVDYPFLDSKHNKYGVKGRALRIATAEDLAVQSRLSEENKSIRRRAQELSFSTGVNVKIVEAEQILGGETLTVYYLSEDRIEIGALLGALKHEHPNTRVELRQVGARDEARLTADYERCGQYCCCKNFLKVLKPVSMRSAKTQKATLDPLKISGRCGRLMCCLRYEDKTYSELKKNLPNRKARVGTPHGDGIVLDAQILTQLVLVRLDDTRTVAVPVEELLKPGESPAQAPIAAPEQRPQRPSKPRSAPERVRTPEPEPLADESEDGTEAAQEATPGPSKRKRRRKKKSQSPESVGGQQTQPDTTSDAPGQDQPEAPTIGRRRRRRAGNADTAPGLPVDGSQPPGTPTRHTPPEGPGDEAGPESGPETASDASDRPRRRRRRRGRGGSGGSGGPGAGTGPDSGSSGTGE